VNLIPNTLQLPTRTLTTFKTPLTSPSDEPLEALEDLEGLLDLEDLEDQETRTD